METLHYEEDLNFKAQKEESLEKEDILENNILFENLLQKNLEWIIQTTIKP